MTNPAMIERGDLKNKVRVVAMSTEMKIRNRQKKIRGTGLSSGSSRCVF